MKKKVLNYHLKEIGVWGLVIFRERISTLNTHSRTSWFYLTFVL